MMKANREKVISILNWCKLKWGLSKYSKVFPKLRVYHHTKGFYENETSSYGSYTWETNTINIHLANHFSYKELCNTVIHEYKHYLMDSKEFQKIQKQMFKKGMDYEEICEKHPHEKKCIRLSEKWDEICLEELKSDLYKRRKNEK